MTDLPGVPQYPFLRGAALQKWHELAPLNAAKPDQLAAYCAAYGRWYEAEEWLVAPDHGPTMTITDDKGQTRSHGPSPQIAIAERALREMARLGRGLKKPGPGGKQR